MLSTHQTQMISPELVRLASVAAMPRPRSCVDTCAELLNVQAVAAGDSKGLVWLVGPLLCGLARTGVQRDGRPACSRATRKKLIRCCKYYHMNCNSANTPVACHWQLATLCVSYFQTRMSSMRQYYRSKVTSQFVSQRTTSLMDPAGRNNVTALCWWGLFPVGIFARRVD